MALKLKTLLISIFVLTFIDGFCQIKGRWFKRVGGLFYQVYLFGNQQVCFGHSKKMIKLGWAYSLP